MMRIFDDIFKQYMQLASKHNLYKNNLNSFKPIQKLPVSNNSMEFNIDPKNFNTSIKNSTVYNYNENIDTFKDFYEKMEFDARRYNRNFDSQTGAGTI